MFRTALNVAAGLLIHWGLHAVAGDEWKCKKQGRHFGVYDSHKKMAWIHWWTWKHRVIGREE